MSISKNIVLSAGLLAGITYGIQSCKKDDRMQNDNLHTDTVTTVLQKNKNIDLTDLNDITGYTKKGLQDTLLLHLDEILQNKNHPFRMKKVGRDLSALLGRNMADSIMYKYNKDLVETLEITGAIDSYGQTLQWTPYDNLEGKTIKIPAIYPGLENFFSKDLRVFLQNNPDFISLVEGETEVVLVTRNSEGKNVLGYYVDGILKMAYYVSPGTGKIKKEKVWIRENGHKVRKKKRINTHTPEGSFWTNLNAERGKKGDKQDSLYESGAFKSPMPYFIPFAKDSIWTGEGNHQGSVDGNKLSHGCVRNPGYGAKYLSKAIGGRKVKYVIYNLYDKKED